MKEATEQEQEVSPEVNAVPIVDKINDELNSMGMTLGRICDKRYKNLIRHKWDIARIIQRYAKEYAELCQPQWISVKDRLPEKGVRVNVYSEKYGVQQSRISVHAYSNDFEKMESKGDLYGDITHWIPLPKSPTL